jgi:hypothetical protein
MLVFAAAVTAKYPAQEAQKSVTTQPWLIGHRGLIRHAPENTLAGFAACIDLRLGFELDVRRTRDGHLVCLHDDDVQRTTNGKGKVANLSLAEVRKLDAGAWFDAVFAGQRVPTLDEVFALLKARRVGRLAPSQSIECPWPAQRSVIAMAFFDVVLQTYGSVHADGEPTDFLSEYTGFIRYTRDRDDKTFRVGKVHAWRLHVGLAHGNGVSVFDVCDAESQELSDLYAALFELRDDDLKLAIRDKFEAVESDILILDYIVLNPRWRGLKLGLLAARKLIDMLAGGCALAVADIQPLHPDAHPSLKVPPSWIPRHESDDLRLARRKLRRYFRNMGFARIRHTRYFGLSLTRKSPTLAEIIKPGKRKGI